jgi:hypothetical protein
MFATRVLLVFLAVTAASPARSVEGTGKAPLLVRETGASTADSVPVTPVRPQAAASVDPSTVSLEVQRAIEGIDSTKQLRIRGAFGRFHGYAATVDADGLHGLRPAPGPGMSIGRYELRWDEIERIDVRRGSARKGAKHGALLVGAVATGFGALVGGGLAAMGDTNEAVWAFAGAGVGLALGSAIGAITGAGVGATIPSWHTVYVRH